MRRLNITGSDGRLLGAFALAGALAVPLDPLATPLSAVAAGMAGALGLWTWRWSRLPDLQRRETRRGAWRLFQPALWLALGLLVGVVLLGIIRMVIAPMVPAIGARIAAAGTLPFWRRVLIIYVAAVAEELLFRLLLLSLIAGLAMRALRVADRAPSPNVIWIANALAALAFAAAHLPAWTSLGQSNPWLLGSVFALNAVPALVLGYVFVTRGIVSAIWTHAGADCAIQLLGPAFA